MEAIPDGLGLLHPRRSGARRIALAFGVSTAALLLTASGAHAQLGPGIGAGVLPPSAVGGNLVNLRDLVDSPLLDQPSELITYDGKIQAQIGYTTNVNRNGGYTDGQKQVGSFEEILSPAASVHLTGNRIQFNGTYAPTASFYNSASSTNRVQQNLDFAAHADVVPDAVFLDLSAIAGQTISGVSRLSSTNAATRSNNTTQYYSFSVTPYFEHTFSNAGTLHAGYTFNDSIFDNQYNQTPGIANNTNSTTHTENASFNTGDNFGAFEHVLTATATQIQGDTSQTAGRTLAFTYDLNYAATTYLTLRAQAGYQQIYYSGTSSHGVQTSVPYKLNGITGGGGFTLTPNEDSSLTAFYGRRDGGENLTLSGTYRPTPRVLLLATSSSGLTSDAQNLRNLQRTTTPGAGGVPISTLTGAPVQYVLANPASVNQLYRQTTTSLSAILSEDRDSFSLTLTQSQSQSPNGTASGGSITATSTSSYGTLGWQHDAPNGLAINASLSYGQTHTGAYAGVGARNQPYMTGTAGLSQAFSDSLRGTLNYYYQRSYNGISTASSSRSTVTNEVLLGLLQLF